jgi:hypothetical protein
MKLIAAGTLALALTANIAQPRTALAWATTDIRWSP